MHRPAIHLSEAARQEFQQAMADAGGAPLRLAISDRFEHELSLGEARDGDVEAESGGVRIVLDPDSAARADGVTIDYVAAADRPGFTIDNPNAPPAVRQLSAAQLKEMRDRGLPFELVDVRTEQERALARIDGSRLLDQPTHDQLLALDRDTPIVFHCHHGIRSQAAAEYFLNAGFRKLYNLAGGIDAWSRDVDPSVPRY